MITIDFATVSDFRNYRLFDPHSKYINPKISESKIYNSEIILAKEDTKLVGLLRFSYIWSTRPSPFISAQSIVVRDDPNVALTPKLNDGADGLASFTPPATP